MTYGFLPTNNKYIYSNCMQSTCFVFLSKMYVLSLKSPASEFHSSAPGILAPCLGELCRGSVLGGNLILQSSLFTVGVCPVVVVVTVGLSEETVHAGQTSVLAGQGRLDVFVRGQLRQVSQSGDRRFTAQHLGAHSFDVAGRHVAY